VLEMLRRADGATLSGTLTVAFVTQQWAGQRGLDRLTQHVKADEMIYVGRLQPRRAAAGVRGGPQAQAQEEALPRGRKEPGSGVLLATAMPGVQLVDFPSEVARIAAENKIPLATEVAATIGRVGNARGPELPKRLAHLGIATAWPVTPAELVDSKDLDSLCNLLELYATGRTSGQSTGKGANADANEVSARKRPATAPATTELLKTLVESYGMSGYEQQVREETARLLPEWAKTETDSDGNLWLRLGVAPAVKKAHRIVFVAHMDELGYAIRSIAADGRLEVVTRGGGILEFFAGHALLVHTASGVRPGVMELPAGWEQPNFEWPRGGAAAASAAGEAQPGPRVLRVDIGARSPEEVAQIGVTTKDWITIPKTYRPLYGTRANGRSFDDRVGCTSLIAAAWALGKTPAGGQAAPKLPAEVIFVWSTREEVGLEGARAVADALAAKGQAPDYVFAVDTFVSSDSPLESKRFANAPIGKGFVIRAVDNSNITDRKYVDKLIALARSNQIAVQYGATGGGNDGSVFTRYGTVDIPISWPLRYSHSPGEVIDTRDVDALSRIVAAIAKAW